MHVLDQEQYGCAARRRREDRVLERSEPEDADACVAVRPPDAAERVEVECKPAAGDERAEPRRDERRRLGRLERTAFLHTRDLPVGERVTDVRERLGSDRERKPGEALVAVDASEHGVDAGGIRHARNRDEAERSAEDEEERELGRRPMCDAVQHCSPYPFGTRRSDHENEGVQDGGFVLALFGATATGKTAVAEELARRLPGELVSADSMQVYRGLPILTNQSPTPARLVAIWELDHEASVAEYQRLAHAAIDEILAARRVPIVVGGTGLYLRAALAELGVPPAPAPGRREHWERIYERVGPERAHAALAERDAAAAARVHPNDRRRVVRALELAEAGASLRPADGRLWSGETRHPTHMFGLDVPRDVLVRRIDTRTRAMFDAGVVEEARRALAAPLSTTARQVMGLVEVATLPRDEAIEALIVRTRRYAAYQRKWMRRIPGLVSVAADRPPGEVADDILEVVRARERLPAGRAG